MIMTKRIMIDKWLIVFLCLLLGFIAGMTTRGYVDEYFQRKNHYPGEVQGLLDTAIALREGKIDDSLKMLDEHVVSTLYRSAVGVDNDEMAELPQDLLWTWQQVKEYYKKYDVVPPWHTSVIERVRQKLEYVPWSKFQLAKQEFKAKYRGNNPQAAPELDITKWFGPALSLNELRGKVILLDFWGVWCNPCLELLPHTQELYAEYNKMGLEVIGIHSSFRTDKTAKFLSENNISFSIGVDSGSTANNYIVTGWPTYYLIDKDGYVAWGPEHDVPSDEQIEALLNN